MNGDNCQKDYSLPPIDPDSSQGRKLVAILHDRLKLVLGADYNDTALANYVMVMLAHKSNRNAVQDALGEFLGDQDSARFTHWIFSNINVFAGQQSRTRRNDGSGDPRNRSSSGARTSPQRSRSRSPPPLRRNTTASQRQPDPVSYRGHWDRKPWEIPSEMDLELERQRRHAADQKQDPVAFHEELVVTRSNPVPVVIPGDPSPTEEEIIQPVYNLEDLNAIQITIPGKAAAMKRGKDFGRLVVVNGRAPVAVGLSAREVQLGAGDRSDPVDQDEIVEAIHNGAPADLGLRSVLIIGFPTNTPNWKIKKHFSRCGYIARFSLLRDPVSGHASNMAWLSFNSVNAAEKAVSLSGSTFHGGNILRVLPKESPEAIAAVEEFNGQGDPGRSMARYVMSPVWNARGRGRRSFKWERKAIG